MIGMLMGLGLSERASKIGLMVGGALLILAAFYMSLHAYGSARYKAGRADADAAWQKASDKAIAKAQNEGGKAAAKAASQQADFAAKQDDERKRIENAQNSGASPFDVLFGNGS